MKQCPCSERISFTVLISSDQALYIDQAQVATGTPKYLTCVQLKQLFEVLCAAALQ